MALLLDTVTLSELRKKSKAAPAVIAWQTAMGGAQAYLSVVTMNEIRYGLLRVKERDPAFGQRLQIWYQEILAAPLLYGIVPVDLTIAEIAAEFRAAHGTPYQDSLIAATAKLHGLTLATRNTEDFEATGIQIINPWNYAG